MRAYRWPGNLRELAEILGHAKAQTAGETIRAAALPRLIREKWLIESSPAVPPVRTLAEAMETLERTIIETAMRESDSPLHAARRLGITKAQLARRLAALGIVEEAEDA